jgi:transcriptional regulator GlxA family with amidase domain
LSEVLQIQSREAELLKIKSARALVRNSQNSVKNVKAAAAFSSSCVRVRLSTSREGM